MPRPPQTANEARLTLETFNAKFEQVKEYSFFRHTKLSAKAYYDLTTGEATHTTDVPTDEQIDAALLSLRFFFVTNEFSRIDYLPTLYSLMGANQNLLDSINKIVAQWVQWKARPSVIAGYDNYRFFEIMIYGNRLHRNQQGNCEVHDGWMKLPEMANVALVDLCSLMHDIIQYANAAYWVNRELLK